MKVKIERTAREVRQDRNGNDCTGVMFGGEWYSMPGDQRKLYNKTVDVEVKGKWARLIAAPVLSNGHGNAAASASVTWDDYREMMERAHVAASGLEPDSPEARAAIVNTVMIAFSNGKVSLPKQDPEQAPPIDDDIPF